MYFKVGFVFFLKWEGGDGSRVGVLSCLFLSPLGVHWSAAHQSALCLFYCSILRSGFILSTENLKYNFVLNVSTALG